MKTSLPVVLDWFKVEDCGDGIYKINEKYIDPYWCGNIWLVLGDHSALVIDTGTGIKHLEPFIKSITDLPVSAVALCSYYDHAGGLYSFEFQACHKDELEGIANATDNQYIEEFLDNVNLTVTPYEGFDITHYRMRSTSPSLIYEEGDLIDLGSRQF